MAKCPIHGDNCPGDDGGFLIDGNHPDDMFGVHAMEQEFKVGQRVRFFDDDAEGVIVGVEVDHIKVQVPDYENEILEVDTTPLQSLTFEVIEE